MSALSAEARTQIDREISKYPPGKRASAVMSALRIVQKERGGWLNHEAIEAVADYLDIPAIRAYEVATFYNMYALKPVGRRKICLCTNLPCLLMGAGETGRALKDTLGIGYGETTADGAITLVEGECFGACGSAPVAIIDNEKMVEGLDGERVAALLAELREDAP